MTDGILEITDKHSAFYGMKLPLTGALLCIREYRKWKSINEDVYTLKEYETVLYDSKTKTKTTVVLGFLIMKSDCWAPTLGISVHLVRDNITRRVNTDMNDPDNIFAVNHAHEVLTDFFDSFAFCEKCGRVDYFFKNFRYICEDCI